MDGPLIDSFPGITLLSPEDTFNRLRRIPYKQACAEYVKGQIGITGPYPYHAEEFRSIMDPILKPFGWTVEEMNKESRRLKELKNSKSV